MRINLDSGSVIQLIAALHDAVLFHAHLRVNAGFANNKSAWEAHDARIKEYQLQAKILEDATQWELWRVAPPGEGAC